MNKRCLPVIFVVMNIIMTGKAFATEARRTADSLQTIGGLTALVTDATNVTVLDGRRGGNFSYSNTGPADYGIIFPRKNGGFWKRSTDSVALSNWYMEPGVTDSAIIQRLVNSKKKYIYIAAGIYYVTDIVVSNSNTNIIGLGSVTLKKSPGSTSNNAILRIQNYADTIRNVKVENINLQFSPSTNQGTDKLYCLIMGNDSKYSENIMMRRCSFDSSGNGFRSMVNIGGNRNMILDSCVFKNSFGAAILVTSVSLDSLAITNCLFTNWACMGNSNDQYNCIGGNGGKFHRFFIYNNKFVNVNGNKFTLELTGKNYDARIINNRFFGNGKAANGISGPFWWNCQFRGNTMVNGSGGHRSGFELVGYNCKIDSNTIENGCISISADSTSRYATADEKVKMGRSFLISKNNLLNSSSCTNSKSIAIGSDYGSVGNVSVLQNTIKNYALGNSQSIGVNGFGDMDSIIIRGNTLEDSGHLTSIRFYSNAAKATRSVTNFKIFENAITVYGNPGSTAIENCAIRFDTETGFRNFNIYDNIYSGYDKITNDNTKDFSTISGNRQGTLHKLNQKKKQ